MTNYANDGGQDENIRADRQLQTRQQSDHIAGEPVGGDRANQDCRRQCHVGWEDFITNLLKLILTNPYRCNSVMNSVAEKV